MKLYDPKDPGMLNDCLQEQILAGLKPGAGINVTQLWRAAGEPEGHDPTTWLGLAAPLIDGLYGYYERVRPGALPEAKASILSLEMARMAGSGDVFTNPQLAILYVTYLQSRDFGGAADR